MAADAARRTVAGDPLRAVEYERAAAEATTFAEAGYPSDAVPRSVAAWAINGRTARQAADSILAEAAAYTEALYTLREARLQAKEQIRTAFADWPENVKLLWAPDGGYAASEGDLAVTTGRFKRVEDGKTVAEGRYVTVWRKNGGGDWKGVIDIGQPDAPPAPPEDPKAANAKDK